MIMVAKMPNCAAAPKNIMNGFLNNGPKSIIAPTAMKIRIGKSSLAMPPSYSTFRNPAEPSCSQTTERGRLTRIAPKPIGSSNIGSYSLLMASQMSTAPMRYITAPCQVSDVKPINKSPINIPFLQKWSKCGGRKSEHTDTGTGICPNQFNESHITVY